MAACAAGMDRQTLRDWVIRFNAGGAVGLRNTPHSERPARMSEGQRATFKALVPCGAGPERDGVSAWRIVDLCRLAEERYSIVYRRGGMLRLVKSPGLSWQKTRPHDPLTDATAQRCFQRGLAATLSEIVRRHFDRMSQLAGQHQPRLPASLQPRPEPDRARPLYLRERFLSHRLFADLGTAIEGCCDAWNRPTAEPEHIASLTDYADLRSVRIS